MSEYVSATICAAAEHQSSREALKCVVTLVVVSELRGPQLPMRAVPDLWFRCPLVTVICP